MNCWEHSGDSTCVLPDGHEAGHEWTADADLILGFFADWAEQR